MRIQNPFRTGLLAGLGVLLALAIGAALGQLATILTYVGAALFLALGLDPIIGLLQRLRFPRWLAILTVLVGVLGVVTLLFFLIVPVIVQQTAALVDRITNLTEDIDLQEFLTRIQNTVGEAFDVRQAVADATAYLQRNLGVITGGVLSAGFAVVSGLGGALIVVILTLYFAASLDSLKRSLYRLVPMTKRDRFAHLAEQIFQAVGRYVIGQVSLALVNGVLSFAFLSIVGAELAAVFAFIAFLGSLIPLVGTLSAAILIVLGQLLLAPNPPAGGGLAVWLIVLIYYAIYMQVEAYVLSPNIMNRAVKVPGVVVVLAALVGGTLLGILGALVAIPVAAAILLIVDQVVLPRQAER